MDALGFVCESVCVCVCVCVQKRESITLKDKEFLLKVIQTSYTFRLGFLYFLVIHGNKISLHLLLSALHICLYCFTQVVRTTHYMSTTKAFPNS